MVIAKTHKRLLCALAVAALGGTPALAAGVHMHKDSGPDPKLDSGNVFATPDSHPGIPTFVSGRGMPLAATRAPRLPEFTIVRQLPSLSQPQRNDINRLDRALQYRTDEVNKIINADRQKITDLKAAPGAKNDAEIAAVQAQISELKNDIQEKRQEAFGSLYDLLSDAQRKQYEEMRHGALPAPGQAAAKPDGSEHNFGTAVTHAATRGGGKSGGLFKGWFRR